MHHAQANETEVFRFTAHKIKFTTQKKKKNREALTHSCQMRKPLF